MKLLPVLLAVAFGDPAPEPAPSPTAPAPTPPSETGRKRVRATRTTEAMVIDGRATEAVWSHTEVRTDFLERQPRLGHAPNFDVEMRIAYDDDNLYVYLETRNMGRKPRVRTLRRDSSGIFWDDWIGLKIDPLRDRRTNYTFFVNADGAQQDLLGLDDGRTGLGQWDAVWQAETVTHDDGYSVEYAIPFYVLGVRSDGDQSMGFNVSVGDMELGADIDWSMITPPLSGIASSQHGDLIGIEGVPSGRALELIPFGLVRTNFQPEFEIDPRRAANVRLGGDMRVKVSAGSYVEATVLTDFAQVNADAVQVAQDRFPLFFPEQRPFFLNGLDVLNFGVPGSAQLFFTRRIGLEGGAPVPLASGVKAYGRNDALTYAVLNVQTLRTFPDPEDPDDDGTPAENFTVARVRSQLTPNLAVGGLTMGRAVFENADTLGQGDHFAGGVDAELRALRSKLRVYGFFAGTWGEDPPRDLERDEETSEIVTLPTDRSTDAGMSGYATVEYRGLYVRPSASWLWSDEDFDPRMGFYRRPGTAIQSAALNFAPRPAVLNLREIVFGPSASFTTDASYDQLLTRTFGGGVAVNWNGGTSISYNVEQFADEVQSDFELYEYLIDADLYQGVRNTLSLSTPNRLAVVGNASAQYADFFGGRLARFTGGLDLRPIKYFSLSGSYTHLLGELDEGETFDFGFANGTVEFAINPNISLDNIVRLSLEPGAERFGLQSRFRWRYRPGSDLFLVYRNGIPLGDGPQDPTDPDPEPFHELMLRVNVYFRTLFKNRRR